MCVLVGYKKKIAENQGELKEMLGLEKLPLDEIYKKEDQEFSNQKDITCLCPIDVPKAVEMAGKRVVWTDFEKSYEWEVFDDAAVV